MSYSIRMASGRVAAGENDFVFTPRTPRVGKIGVVMFHGASTPNMGIANPSWPSLMRLCAAIANAGITIVAPSNGVDAYANDTAMSRITASIALLAAQGCDATKAHLIGVSMGGGTSARYAGLNPTKVASVNALIPMAKPMSLYQGLLGPGTTVGSETDAFLLPLAPAWGITPHAVTMTLVSGSKNVTLTAGTASAADVGGAVGFTAHAIAGIQSVTDSTHIVMDRNAASSGSFTANLYAPLPAGADIIGIAAAANTAGIPGRLFYGTVDPYIRPPDVQALATSAGWEANALTGQGHADGAAAAWSTYNGGTEFSDLISYLLARGA